MENYICKFIVPTDAPDMSTGLVVEQSGQFVRHARNALKNLSRFLPRPEKFRPEGGLKSLRLASVLSAAMLTSVFTLGADGPSSGATTNQSQGGSQETASSMQASDVVRKLNAGNQRMRTGHSQETGLQGPSSGQQFPSGRVRAVDAFVVTSVELAPLVPEILDAEPGAIVTEAVDLENITEDDVRRIVEKFLTTNAPLFLVLVQPTPELEALYGGSKSQMDDALDRIATNARNRILDLSPILNDRVRNGTLSMINGTYNRTSLEVVLLRMPSGGQTWDSGYRLPPPDTMIPVSPSS
ncbi:hypothetical protein Ga0100231_024450 [Opitutaceae bacterium TAV4]|nr:hypothetical protein Ga0100231_024450 [Opitutaceae bacterium TAV4]RRK00850.1 hypothetical protein Ga0100230_024015 [Opitutaceae bacterium TAV3]